MRAQFQLVVFAAVGMTASFAALTSGVSVDNVREDFTAFAINLNPGPTTARIDIRIERWSTDEEREQLLDILRGEGSRSRTNRELLRALRRMPRADPRTSNLVLENYSHLPVRLNRIRPR